MIRNSFTYFFCRFELKENDKISQRCANQLILRQRMLIFQVECFFFHRATYLWEDLQIDVKEAFS